MMKQLKIKHIGAASLAALMLLSLAACSNEDDAATTQPAGKKLVMTAYNGENEQSMTRGAHWEDNNTHTGGLSFHWDVAGNNQAGDELYDIYSMVITKDGTIGASWSTEPDKNFSIPYSSLKIELTGQPDKATLTSRYYLDASKHSAGNAIYCITPILNAPDPDIPNSFYKNLAMPTDFTQAASGDAKHLKDYMYMTGTGTLKGETDQQLTSSDLYFKHIPATIRIALTNQRPEAATVTSIVMRETNGSKIFPNEKQWKCLMGTVTDENTRVSILEPTDKTGYTSSVTLNLTDANIAAEGKYYGYMLVLPQDAEHALADKHLTFDITTQDGNTYTSFSMDASELKKITKKQNFVSGYVYTFNLTLNDKLTLSGVEVTTPSGSTTPLPGWGTEDGETEIK
ncbi:fimbrillin family protein [Bacteroides sp.]|uniref:fimbrillin family protein n=1 Tax=Bacteroides sp. TaxID=29523 RepID=UPI00261AE338|nr:fimbrillin family protein [Bacteroides sp.]MDD3039894.1 fimbrillin family protein [Bacteroides sp.]